MWCRTPPHQSGNKDRGFAGRSGREQEILPCVPKDGQLEENDSVKVVNEIHRRVLIVDDEQAICELIEKTVSTAGMDALVLNNSSQAARALSAAKFDLVFLDFHMTAPDGVELARQVRQTRSNRMTPVVLISDDQRPSVVSVGFEAGASFMLYKPIDKERLQKILRATQTTVERERRRTRRVPVQNRVQLRSGAEQIEGETIDMSLSGMLVRAQRALAPGTRLHLSLHLSPGTKPLAGLGTVARLTSRNYMGIHLEQVDSKESERLEEFLLPLIPDVNR